MVDVSEYVRHEPVDEFVLTVETSTIVVIPTISKIMTIADFDCGPEVDL